MRQQSGNKWALVSPAKIGRSHMKSPQGNETEVQISASKYSVLSVDEDVEEGEVLREEQEENVDDISEASDQMRELENDLLEDVILTRKVKEKDEAVMKKGVTRNQKAKTQDVNAKSTRPSRKKH